MKALCGKEEMRSSKSIGICKKEEWEEFLIQILSQGILRTINNSNNIMSSETNKKAIFALFLPNIKIITQKQII